MCRKACGKHTSNSVPCAKIIVVFAKYKVQKVRMNDQLPPVRSMVQIWDMPKLTLPPKESLL